MLENPHKIKLAASIRGGRGVFATCPITKGEIIDVNPFIGLLPDELPDYAFVDIKCGRVLPMGLVSLINHSSKQANSEYVFDDEKEVIILTATRNIASDEEVLFDYHWPNYPPFFTE